MVKFKISHPLCRKLNYVPTHHRNLRSLSHIIIRATLSMFIYLGCCVTTTTIMYVCLTYLDISFSVLDGESPIVA